MTTSTLDHSAILSRSPDQLLVTPDRADSLGMTETRLIMDAILREYFVCKPIRDCASLARQKLDHPT